MSIAPSDIQRNEEPPHTLRARRFGIDTLRESVVYMRPDCHVCRAEGFRSQARIEVCADGTEARLAHSPPVESMSDVRALLSDGTQPVGRGIGPALEAHDVLAVLQCAPDIVMVQ